MSQESPHFSSVVFFAFSNERALTNDTVTALFGVCDLILSMPVDLDVRSLSEHRTNLEEPMATQAPVNMDKKSYQILVLENSTVNRLQCGRASFGVGLTTIRPESRHLQLTGRRVTLLWASECDLLGGVKRTNWECIIKWK